MNEILSGYDVCVLDYNGVLNKDGVFAPRETLEKIRDAFGDLILLSSYEKSDIFLDLMGEGIYDIFSEVYGSEDKKWSYFKKIIGDYGKGDPGKVLYVDDQHGSFKLLKSMGIGLVGMVSGNSTEDEFKSAGADYVIYSLDELVGSRK